MQLRNIIFACAFLSFLHSSLADSSVIIDIATNDGAVVYSLQNQQLPLDELQSRITRIIDRFGNTIPIIIRPDTRTSFHDVSELIRLLTTRGVEKVEIPTFYHDDGHNITSRSLTISRGRLVEFLYPSSKDSIHSKAKDAASPEK